VVDRENKEVFSHFRPYPGGIQSSRIKICSVISVGIVIIALPDIHIFYFLIMKLVITDSVISVISCASLGNFLYNNTIYPS